MALHSKEKIGGRQQGATVSNMSFIFADQETNISPYLRHREKEKKKKMQPCSRFIEMKVK